MYIYIHHPLYGEEQSEVCKRGTYFARITQSDIILNELLGKLSTKLEWESPQSRSIQLGGGKPM